MALFACSARYRLGLLRGGDAGRDMVNEATEWMRQQNIGAPHRMVALLAPVAPS